MLKIDDYAYTNALKHVHPAEKVGFALAFLLFTIMTKILIIALITFAVMSICLVLVAKIPLSHYIKLLLLPLIFLFTSIIAILISVAPMNSVSIHPIWHVNIGSWKIFISQANVKQVYQLSATVIASVSCLYFLILTTPLNQLLWVLRKFKIPVLFIELVGLTYRFIFILLDKMQEVYLAQSSRLGYQNNRVMITSAAQLIVSLLLNQYNLRENCRLPLKAGVEMRGYMKLI